MTEFSLHDVLQAVDDLVDAANRAEVADDLDAAVREVEMALNHTLLVFWHDCPTTAAVRDALQDVVTDILEGIRQRRQ